MKEIQLGIQLQQKTMQKDNAKEISQKFVDNVLNRMGNQLKNSRQIYETSEKQNESESTMEVGQSKSALNYEQKITLDKYEKKKQYERRQEAKKREHYENLGNIQFLHRMLEDEDFKNAILNADDMLTI